MWKIRIETRVLACVMSGSHSAFFFKVKVTHYIFVDTGSIELLPNQIIKVKDKLKFSLTLLSKLRFSFDKFSQNSQLLGGTLWRSLTTHSIQIGHKNSYKLLSKRWPTLRQILRNMHLFDDAYREFHVHLRNLSLTDTKAERL